MKARVVEDADVVTYVVVGEPGDEAVAALRQFARTEDLEAYRARAHRSGPVRDVTGPGGPPGNGAARKAFTTGASSAASVASARWPPW